MVGRLPMPEVRPESTAQQSRLPVRSLVERLVVGEVGRLGSVGVHDPDVVEPAGVADERDPRPVRRPVWLDVGRVVVGEPVDQGSVGAHPIDLHLAVSIALESDTGAVRRPVGLGVDRGIGREPLDVAAVAVHDVDVELATGSARSLLNAISPPSCEKAGWAKTKNGSKQPHSLASGLCVRLTTLVPSASMRKMSKLPSIVETNASSSPVGDQAAELSRVF